jgi:hypothetical protein
VSQKRKQKLLESMRLGKANSQFLKQVLELLFDCLPVAGRLEEPAGGVVAIHAAVKNPIRRTDTLFR